MRVYLDNAATTPIREEVIQAMLPVMRETFGNPSSIHAAGRKARAAIEQARKTVAQTINASIGEIFFTSGGTESNNMALKCAVRDLGVQRIITSEIEHHCILHTVQALERDCKLQIDHVQVDSNGYVDYMHLEALLQDSSSKTLVSLMHGNNEVGALLDLERVSALCEAAGALFHSDTVQTMGHFPIDVDALNINFLTGSAHKFHGPKGVGFVYINGDNMIKPYIDGGAQERNMRAGTENIYGIIGLAKALELATEELDIHKIYITDLRNYMASQLQEQFEDIQFNTDLDRPSLYTVLNVSFPPSPKAELLLLNLDISGISASGGSACSSGSDKGSHVLRAIQSDPTRKSIRFSFSHFNTKEDVDYVIEKLKAIIPTRTSVLA